MPSKLYYLHNVSTHHTWMSSRGIIRLCTLYELSPSYLSHWKPYTLLSVMSAGNRHYRNRSNIYLQLSHLRSAFFRNFTQHRILVYHPRFGKTYWFHLQGPSSLLGLLDAWRWYLKGCPKTSVINYNSTLCKISDECRSYIHCEGNLKPLNIPLALCYC